jgi:phosphatidate cytidylyltransferase
MSLPGFAHPIWRMVWIVGALLVLASVAVASLCALQPRKNHAELTARVRAWWFMAAVFFAALALSPAVPILLFAFLSFWALKEYVTLLQTRPADHRVLFFTFLAVPVQYYWVHTGWYGMFVLFIPVYVFLLLPFGLVLTQETAGFVAAAAQIQWGMMAFVFGLSHLAYLTRLPVEAGLPGVDGKTLLVFLAFTVEMSDVMQYVWGKTLGRHRILPGVSPNKTWEGLLGGIATATALSLGIRFLTPFSVGETLLVSVLITVAGFCGGAVMSAVKRDFGVKDFGGLIPGHGGVLDRVDSLCYAAPVFFHYVRYFHSP